jgi:hypothetical protein
VHVFLSCLVCEILLNLLQQCVKSLILSLMDSNTGKHALVGQISFRELSWIEQGYRICLIHHEDSCKVGSLLESFILGSRSTVNTVDGELKLTIVHIEEHSNPCSICDW